MIPKTGETSGSFRNMVTSKSRSDKTAWEQKQLDDKENPSSDIWKCVKGWLGWSGGGTPSKLYGDKSSWPVLYDEQVFP